MKRHRFGTSGVGRALMALRGYGWKLSRGDAVDLASGLESFGFVRIEEVPGREIVFGLVGRFWKLSGELRRLTAEEFIRFDEEGWAKGALGFAVAPAGGGAELSTETRVRCLGDEARRKFRRYWSLIEPFSGLMRIELLRGVRREALRSERARREGGAS